MAGITYTIGADGKPLMEAMDTAQRAVERFKKNVTNNEAAVRVTKLQTEADKARVSGQELLAKKIENEIALEQRLIAIRHSGATQAQKDDLEDHARTQRVLADRQAEINQAQKLANIQRGNMPGQAMSDGAKRFRMMNVSAQLQDVAVQAQMGTSISTIAAQQGPQLISALGGSGAMAGAAAGAAIAVAVGTALYGMGEQAAKSFANIKAEAIAMNDEVAKIVATASTQGEVGGGIKSNEERLKNINLQQAASQAVLGSIADRIRSWQDGVGVQEHANELELQKGKIQRANAELQNKSIELSGEQIKRANLIAEGDERGIAALDRKLKLDKEIYEIRHSLLGIEAQEAAIHAANVASRQQEIKQEKDRQKAVKDAEEKTTDSLTVNRARLDKGDIEAEDIERKIKLTRELQEVTENKNLMPWEKARAINLITEREEIASKQRLKDIGKQIEEEADADQKKIDDRRKKHREDIEKQKIDEAKKADDEMRKLHEKADADISKAIDSIEERRKAKLKPEQRLAEAKAEMENAREIFGKFAPGSLKQKQAGAFLAEKTMEFEKLREEKREKDIQRAIGGSIAEGAARRSERAAERARLRAERIVINREVNKKRGEMERQRRPQKEIDAALDEIRGRRPEVKDAQKEVVGAIDKTNGKLDEILKKLTVA